jgi:hypothetical protein
MVAEKPAPIRKKTDRKIFSVVSLPSPCTGNRNSSRNATTAKTDSVLNWRDR